MYPNIGNQGCGSASLYSVSGSDFSFNVDRDPDPAPHQSVAMTNGLQTLHGSILSLHTSIVSVHGPPWLHFMPRRILNFVFDADPDP